MKKQATFFLCANIFVLSLMHTEPIKVQSIQLLNKTEKTIRVKAKYILPNNGYLSTFKKTIEHTVEPGQPILFPIFIIPNKSDLQGPSPKKKLLGQVRNIFRNDSQKHLSRSNSDESLSPKSPSSAESTGVSRKAFSEGDIAALDAKNRCVYLLSIKCQNLNKQPYPQPVEIAFIPQKFYETYSPNITANHIREGLFKIKYVIPRRSLILKEINKNMSAKGISFIGKRNHQYKPEEDKDMLKYGSAFVICEKTITNKKESSEEEEEKRKQLQSEE